MNGRFVLAAAGILCILGCTQPALGNNMKKASPPGTNKSSTDKPAIRDKWALLIGINRFADPSIPGLKYAQKSAADVSRALKDPDAGRFAPDHVFLLNGQDATKTGIEQVLEQWLYKKALPNDLVMVYLSSRLVPTTNGQEPIICSSDTQMKDAEHTGINLHETLKTIRQRVGSENIICLLDCNPVSTKSATGEENQAKSETQNKDLKWLSTSGVTILSANALFKPSFDDDKALASRFSHYFVEVIKGSQGAMPFYVMAEYVHQKILEDTQNANGEEQKPAMVLSSLQSQTPSIIIGMPIKSNQQGNIAIGHPLDNLALNRPDIVAPTTLKANAQNINPGVPKLPSAETAKAKPATPAKELEDDDDDHVDQNLDFGSYMSKMKQDIQKRWQPPKGFESRRVTTVFTIKNDGSITDPQISEGSGNEEVDKSALAALQAASPLDPLPKGSPRSVDIRYVFDWKSSVKH